MPHRCIYSTSDKYDSYKTEFNKTLIEVEEVDSGYFSDTNMLDVGIFTFDLNKLKDQDILIKYKNDKQEYVKSLFNISNITDYENEFLNYILCDINNINYNMFAPRKDYKDPNKKMKEYFTRWGKKLTKNIFLIACSANGAINGKFFSGTNGKILNGKEELYNYLVNTKGATCNIMQFDSKTAALNCKMAMQNPLLRLGLSKLQDD